MDPGEIDHHIRASKLPHSYHVDKAARFQVFVLTHTYT